MDLKREFEKKYPDAKEIKTSFCPYRICPMGAHSDHQYGKITGFAIDQGITICYEKTNRAVFDLQSLNFTEPVSFVGDKPLLKLGDWADYLRGCVESLKRKYDIEFGIRALISGSMPIGGLSSSAAVILAFLSAVCDVNNIQLDAEELIDTALWAEKDFVGVSVGTLDQSCEVYSKKDHLLYLDTKDNSYELIPQSKIMKPYEIMVFFSGVERTLVGSAFNMRVDELKAAAYALKGFSGMEYGKFADTRLRDVPREVFEKYKDKLPENWRRRATHFYTEFERVEKGAEAFRNGDIETFGKLSFESGHSSIYNYETGSDELKTLYEIMLKTEGIYGGRFSGAGFKGCCMALVDPAFSEQIKEKVEGDYLKKFPQLKGKYSAYICHNADGCRLN